MIAIIEARQLQKSFGASHAVRGVSFSVNEGEFLSLLGESGSGKTTILRMIAGLERPTSGEVLCRGRDITELPPAQRDMRMVFQDYALFPNLTVWDNVAFGLRLRISRGRVSAEEVKTRVGQFLETVQLSAHAGKRPHQLSGGQKQRVSLARALVTDPPVVLFDEPLGSLDASMRKVMQLELKRLHRGLRKTFIYVTHDQEEAMGLSDRVAVLKDGELLQLATPEQIYAQPNCVAVARFLGTANVLTGTAAAAAEGGTTLELPGGAGIGLGARPAAAAGTALTVMIRAEHVSLAPPDSRVAGAHPARVVERLFLGDKVRYELELAAGGLGVTAIESGERQPFAVGDNVNLTIDPANVCVIPEGARSAA